MDKRATSSRAHEYIEPRYVNDKPRWGNQGDTGYDKFGGGQGKERSVTFFGIAAAMAPAGVRKINLDFPQLTYYNFTEIGGVERYG